jgi:hypothetical protein
MLNLLSMDFKFTGDSADFLRYGAYPAGLARRTYLGTAFVLPVYRHKRLSDVLLDEKFMRNGRQPRGKRAGFRAPARATSPDASGRRHPRDHV